MKMNESDFIALAKEKHTKLAALSEEEGFYKKKEF